MKKFFSLILILAFIPFVYAQEGLDYQKPPKEILDLVDVQLAPSVLLDDEKEYMVLLYRDTYKSIEELSEEELRLGGLRINPKTNIGSRVTYYNNIEIKNIKDPKGKILPVKGLPSNPRLTNFSWSPNQQKIAVTNTTEDGVELWVLDLKNATVDKLTEAGVNANLGDVINWFEDGKSILVKMLPESREPLVNTRDFVPTGPTISVNDGKKAQNRTYQDLLKNKNDEHNFEQLALADLYRVTLDGDKEKWLSTAMYDDISFSPDGEYVMVNTVEKPFSYLVPYYRFPSATTIYTKDGDPV